jgi:hypothetical protein
MIELDRDPRTGQFRAANVALPSPRDMQAAYKRGGRPAVRPLFLPNERDIAAAAGVEPVRKYPLGAAARAEAAGIGDAVSMFLRNYKR